MGSDDVCCRPAPLRRNPAPLPAGEAFEIDLIDYGYYEKYHLVDCMPVH